MDKDIIKHHPLAALAVHHMIPPIISEIDRSESAMESMNRGKTWKRDVHTVCDNVMSLITFEDLSCLLHNTDMMIDNEPPKLQREQVHFTSPPKKVNTLY